MKIRTRLTLFTNIAIMATTAVLVLGSHHILKGFLNESVQESRRLHSMNWQLTARDSILNKQVDGLVRQAQMIAMKPEIDYAFVYGPDGKIVAHSIPRFIGLSISDWEGKFKLEVDEYSIPFHLEGKQYRAAIAFSLAFERKQLNAQVISLTLKILILAGVMLAIGILGSGFVSDTLTKRLYSMIAASKKIESGDFSTRVDEGSKDELADLATALNGMTERLGRLEEMKDGFVSAVSHDLRSPLAAIIMWVNHMLDSDENKDKILPQHRQFLSTIKDLAQRLSVYILNVLNLAKIKAGSMNYDIAAVDLAESVKTTMNVYSYLAKKKGVALETEVPSNLPALSADREHLDHTISNLIGNALKFTRPGGSVRLIGKAENGHIEVRVADTGLGIPKEQLPDLFDAFFQADVDRQKKENIKGTGLGLYIVKQHVDGMGGSIEVESEPGKGSCFTMKFPKAKEAASSHG
jgi:signal transduction histidine kinase